MIPHRDDGLFRFSLRITPHTGPFLRVYSLGIGVLEQGSITSICVTKTGYTKYTTNKQCAPIIGLPPLSSSNGLQSLVKVTQHLLAEKYQRPRIYHALLATDVSQGPMMAACSREIPGRVDPSVTLHNVLPIKAFYKHRARVPINSVTVSNTSCSVGSIDA